MNKTVTFKYQQERSGILGNNIKRPVAEIFLKSKSSEWLKIHPYIDSGADTTLIPFSTGEFLGLTYKESEVVKIGGLIGTTKAIRKKVTVKIGEVEFILNVTWALTESVPALLGRKDVFDKFDVTFKQKDGIVIFEER